MKYILLLSLIFNALIMASSEVILGTFSTQESAETIKSKIDDEIAKDSIFRNFLSKKNIQSAIKESDDYFIVTLGPIDDIVAKKGILKRVKKANFTDAYLSTIKETDEELNVDEYEVLQEEINSDEDIIEQEENTTQEINQEASDIEKESSQNSEYISQEPIKKDIIQIRRVSTTNILNKYLLEIIASIVVLILLIIYTLSKRKNYINDELHDYSKQNNSSEYDIMEDNHNTHIDISYPTSNVIKKDIAPHEKITKSDFKKFAGSKIMIAEDNIINQKVINGLLSESQMDIVTVDDGQEVLEHLKHDSDFSIILMDAHMPNMDGYEATKIIRENPNYEHITVIALSGDTSQDDINKMKKVGMQEHLEKPLKMDSLYDIFSAYIYLPHEQADSKISIDDFKELNVADGLLICGNDKEFYREILGDFINKYSNIDIEIQKLINNKSYDDLEITLLDVAGVSANIGAHNLSNLTKDLRRSIKFLDNDETIKIFQEFKDSLERLKPEIKSYI